MRNTKGVTLIEILLSLLVLVIGIVGILAIFPSALQQSKETVQERAALIYGESVKAALANAMRFPDVGGNRIMTHDMEAGTLLWPYVFPLPTLQVGWVRHPNGADVNGLNPIPNPADPELDPAFKLGTDGWLSASVDYVHNTNDPTDPYRQFLFSFDVCRVNTLWYRLGQPDGAGGTWTEATLTPQCKLFEFKIHVMRQKGVNSAGGSGTGGGGTGVANPLKSHILSLMDRLSMK